MEYLIRLIQIHETFRKPELEALAEVANIQLEFVFYSADVSWTIPTTNISCIFCPCYA